MFLAWLMYLLLRRLRMFSLHHSQLLGQLFQTLFVVRALFWFFNQDLEDGIIFWLISYFLLIYLFTLIASSLQFIFILGLMLGSLFLFRL